MSMALLIGDWSFGGASRVEDPKGYPLFKNSSIIEKAKDYARAEAARHGYALSSTSATSYLSYWLQILKDLNHWWLCRRVRKQVDTREIVERAIAFAEPWRFTCQFIDFLNVYIGPSLRTFATEAEFVKSFESKIDDAIKEGGLYSFTRYQKAAHVITDLSFDAGWSSRFSVVSGLKEKEGLVQDIERATMHRTLSLYLARLAINENMPVAARDLLLFGFPTSSELILRLDDGLIRTLVMQPDRKIVDYLLKDEISEESIRKNASAIVNGALGVLRGG